MALLLTSLGREWRGQCGAFSWWQSPRVRRLHTCFSITTAVSLTKASSGPPAPGLSSFPPSTPASSIAHTYNTVVNNRATILTEISDFKVHVLSISERPFLPFVSVSVCQSLSPHLLCAELGCGAVLSGGLLEDCAHHFLAKLACPVHGCYLCLIPLLRLTVNNLFFVQKSTLPSFLPSTEAF